MATYKYQQELGGGDGWIKYNVTPDLGTRLLPGDTFTISGQIYDRNYKHYGITATAGERMWPASGNSADLGTVTKTVSKGSQATFTINCTIPDRMSTWGTERSYQAYISFTAWDDAEFSGGSGTTEVEEQKLTILKNRIAPVINSVTIADLAEGYDRFGAYIQTHNQLKFTLTVTVDPLDPDTTFRSTEVYVGDTRMYTSQKIVNFDPLTYVGTIAYSVKVWDNRGMTATTSGTLEFLAYTPPALNLPVNAIERYKKTKDDQGQDIYIPADDGTHVWINLSMTVQAYAEATSVGNPWSLTCAYDDADPIPTKTGSDGGTFSYLQDRTYITGEISASERYDFVLALSDYFEVVSYIVSVDKAGGYMNVEKHGVAVGMRSTADIDHKKFECDYPAYFYKGIVVGAGNLRYANPGSDGFAWCSGTKFTSYGDSFIPTLARCGNEVFLDGMVKNTASLTINATEQNVLQLPDWAKPRQDVFMLHQGSSTCFFWLRINASSGIVTISRYRNVNSTSYPSVSSGAQFPITSRWIAADAYEEEQTDE